MSICQQIKNNLHSIQITCYNNNCQIWMTDDDIHNIHSDLLRDCMTPQTIEKKCHKPHYERYKIKARYRH